MDLFPITVYDFFFTNGLIYPLCFDFISCKSAPIVRLENLPFFLHTRGRYIAQEVLPINQLIDILCELTTHEKLFFGKLYLRDVGYTIH